MKITKADRKVLDAFGDRRPATSKNLTSTGDRLNGNWMGGSGIARWSSRGHIVEGDLGSRAAQTVQRALRKMTPPNSYKPKPKPRPRGNGRSDVNEKIRREQLKIDRLKGGF